MKPSRLFLLSLGLFSCFATTATAYENFNYTGIAWVDGVDENSGWYDANKIDNNDEDADDNMCYAASAANLITWWQNHEQSQHLTSSAPKQLNSIWDTFVQNNQIWDDGGETLSAVNWWISGVYAPTTEDDYGRYYVPKEYLPEDYLPLTLPRTNGYYYDQCGLTQDNLANFLSDEWVYGEDDSAAEINFYDMFDSGMAVALSINSELDEDFAHAITLWGAEYTDGKLEKLWLTDSDDYADDPGLFSADVTLSEDGSKIYFDDEELYGSQVYISGVYSLDPNESASWQMVPEPATATLSLLALCGLASRRRRK